MAQGVFVHQGRHLSIEDPQRADIANAGFVIGSRCVAVIDTGGSLEFGRRLREAVSARTALPVCYVINTHGHFDHLLGNAAFRGEGTHFVGHAALADHIEASRPFFLEEFAAELGPGAKPEDIVAPDEAVADRMELDLGDRTLEVAAHAAAHTHADLTVLDRGAGILWLGDLLFVERVPILDGSLRGWLALLPQLEALPAARAVPGHGPATVPWPAAAEPERRYLGTLLRDVRGGIAEGRFMEEVLETAAAAERSRWLLFDEHHGRNVTKAFTELEWE